MSIRREILLSLALLAIIALFLCLVARESSAKTITVDDDGGADHTTIRSAYFAANNGDTIRVYEGVYKESLDISKRIILIGNGSANTTISYSGTSKDEIVLIEKDEVRMSGFRLNNNGDKYYNLRITADDCDISDLVCQNADRYNIFIDGGENNLIANTSCQIENARGFSLHRANGNVLENNSVSPLEDSYSHLGFFLEYSSNCELRNNNCSDLRGGGILLRGSNHTLIKNNLISNTSSGLTIASSEKNIVIGNVLVMNVGMSISLSITSDTRVVGNICPRITLRDSENCLIENNTCSGSEYYALQIEPDCDKLKVINNNFSAELVDISVYCDEPSLVFMGNQLGGRGFLLREGDWRNIEIHQNNSVGGKPVYFFKNEEDPGEIPGDAGQLIFTHCSDFVIEQMNLSNRAAGILVMDSDHFSINEVECWNSSYLGIRIWDSSFVNISNSSFSNGTDQGIYLRNSGDVFLENTTTSGNGMEGIWIVDSSRIRLLRCRSDGNQNGFLLQGSEMSVENCSLSFNGNGIYAIVSHGSFTGNIFSVNGIGIDLMPGSRDLRLSRNNCSGNGIGIALQYCGGFLLDNNSCRESSLYGILILGSSNNLLENNSVCSNIQTGIEIESNSDGNTLKDNLIKDNEKGIVVKGSCDSTRINYNAFLGNTEFAIDAQNNNGVTVQASSNSWGTLSGPYHAEKNPEGTGDNISDEVDIDFHFLPFVELPSLSSWELLEGEEVEFRGTGYVFGYRPRYAWSSSLDGELYRGFSRSFSTTELANGSHTIYLKVQDPFGTWSEAQVTTLHVNGKPRLKEVLVSPEIALEGTELNFTCKVEDDGDQLLYRWSSTLQGELYEGPNASFNRSSLKPGIHQISLKIKDEHGVWSEKLRVPITVTERPEVEQVYVVPGVVIQGKTVQFTAVASDDGSVSRYVWFSSLDGEFHNGSEGSMESRGLSAGEHTITLLVQDDLGFWSHAAQENLLVHLRPKARIDSILPDQALDTDSITFSGSGTDDGSIEGYSWSSSLNGELYNGTDASFDRTGLDFGVHTIFLRVMDDKGAWSKETSRSLTVTRFVPPNNLPTLMLSKPANGSTVNGIITISGTAWDKEGGLNSVDISIDGGDWLTVTGVESWNYNWDTTTVENGDHQLRFRASDGEDLSAETILDVMVENKETKEEKNDSPGFGLVLSTLSLALLAALKRRPRKMV